MEESQKAKRFLKNVRPITGLEKKFVMSEIKKLCMLLKI